MLNPALVAPPPRHRPFVLAPGVVAHHLLRRHAWVIVALTVMATATFAARAANRVLEAAYLADATHGPAIAPPAPAPTVRRSKQGAPLIARNMLCAACPAPSVEPPPPVDPDAIAPTALPLTLVATHVANAAVATDRANFATIVNTGTRAQGAYWVGDALPGAGPVVAVHATCVDFQNARTGRTERIALAGGAPGPAAPPSTTGATATGITQIDATTFEIDQRLIAQARANPMALVGGARVLPASAHGVAAGFKLYAIRPGSVFASLGLVDGDTITAVNGLALDSLASVNTIYAKLGDATAFDLAIDRRGAAVTLHYSIH